jgi:hypothetical protein
MRENEVGPRGFGVEPKRRPSIFYCLAQPPSNSSSFFLISNYDSLSLDLDRLIFSLFVG